MRVSWIELGKLAASSIPYQTEDILSVHEQGIRAILTLTEHPLTTYKHLTSDFFEGLDIRYFHVGIPDQEGPTVEQAEQISRSSTTCTAKTDRSWYTATPGLAALEQPCTCTIWRRA